MEASSRRRAPPADGDLAAAAVVAVGRIWCIDGSSLVGRPSALESRPVQP